jgi:plastocyanin
MRIRMLVAAVGSGVLGACGGSDASPTKPPAAPTNKSYEVFTLSTAFIPNFIQIIPGDTIRYKIVPSANGEGHDVTFDRIAGAPANVPVTLNGTFNRVFNTRGTFHYNCFVHPGMSGDVIVQ